MNKLTLGDISIDCNNPEELRDFYAQLSGWETCVMYNCPALIADKGLVILFMACDFDYAQPVWPEETGKQQKQMHFNFGVNDLSASVENALSIGATKPSQQFGGNDFVTLLDPEGHPFCLCKKDNPYEIPPTYKCRSFTLRLVSVDDAEDLLECYSDPKAHPIFNADNCTGDFKMYTLDDMSRCIEFWLEAYNNKEFIRLSIVDNETSKAVGTVEIFGGEYGVLRVDVISSYEKASYLSEIFGIADSFFCDYGCENIITKAIPEAIERIKALTKCNYTQSTVGDGKNREHYYLKNNK